MTGYAFPAPTVPALLTAFNVTPLGWLVLRFTRGGQAFQRRINLNRPGAGLFMVWATDELCFRRGCWDEYDSRADMTIHHSIGGFRVKAERQTVQALRSALWGGLEAA